MHLVAQLLGTRRRRILVACEFSGTVRDAFAAVGYDAWSCDLLPCDTPGNHIQGDCVEAISQGWDDIIMHPPCTAMAVSGNRTYGTGKPKEGEREKAVKWTWDLWHHAKAHAQRVAMENPIGVLSRTMKPTQVIHPYQFGHMEQKSTCLWLHGFPKLVETNNVYAEMMLLPKNVRERMFYMPPSADRGKLRSITYAGIAQAMANQWRTAP